MRNITFCNYDWKIKVRRDAIPNLRLIYFFSKTEKINIPEIRSHDIMCNILNSFIFLIISVAALERLECI